MRPSLCFLILFRTSEQSLLDLVKITCSSFGILDTGRSNSNINYYTNWLGILKVHHFHRFAPFDPCAKMLSRRLHAT